MMIFLSNDHCYRSIFAISLPSVQFTVTSLALSTQREPIKMDILLTSLEVCMHRYTQTLSLARCVYYAICAMAHIHSFIKKKLFLLFREPINRSLTHHHCSTTEEKKNRTDNGILVQNDCHDCHHLNLLQFFNFFFWFSTKSLMIGLIFPSKKYCSYSIWHNGSNTFYA